VRRVTEFCAKWLFKAIGTIMQYKEGERKKWRACAPVRINR
jgi:hypothetical protein